MRIRLKAHVDLSKVINSAAFASSAQPPQLSFRAKQYHSDQAIPLQRALTKPFTAYIVRMLLRTLPSWRPLRNLSSKPSTETKQKKIEPTTSLGDHSYPVPAGTVQSSEATPQTYSKLEEPLSILVTTGAECLILRLFHLQSKSGLQSSFGSWTNVWENDYEEATSKRTCFLSAFILGFLWPNLQCTFINVIRTSLCLTQTRLWVWLKNMTDHTFFHTCSPPPPLFRGLGKF